MHVDVVEAGEVGVGIGGAGQEAVGDLRPRQIRRSNQLVTRPGTNQTGLVSHAAGPALQEQDPFVAIFVRPHDPLLRPEGMGLAVDQDRHDLRVSAHVP